MRAHEFITEGRNHPVIVVDVQPEYSGMNDGDENPVFEQIIWFVVNQTGPVLMFVNAEHSGLTGDSIRDIQAYWDDTVGDPGEEYWDENDEYHYTKPSSPIDWRRFQIVDKGYGHLRSWMDRGTSPAAIIKVIREMYQQRVSDSRDLFGGEMSGDYDEKMRALIGREYRQFDLDDPLIVNWTSVAQLKRFNGAYIVGGGQNECLREVELLMNAFNIRYKRIDSLVYG
jgi:hypothetical protein